MLEILNKLIEKYALDIRGVIHIGAHYGEEYLTYIINDIENIIMIEPLPNAFEIIQNKFKDDQNLTLFNLALGAENKKVTINIDSTNKGLSSSILKPKLHLEQYPDIIFDKVIETEQNKLDDLIIYRKNYNLIAVDVQGYELEVFKGSVSTLENIDYIISEVNRAELYENSCLIEDLDNFLAGFNFTRVETNWAGNTWGDALYIKNNISDKSPKKDFNGFPEIINSDLIETIKKPDLDYYYKKEFSYSDPAKIAINDSGYSASVQVFKEIPLPKISVIIESFNENKHLEECINSILEQNYPNLECLFLDGGNIENSAKIMKKYESYVVHKPINDYQDRYSFINEALQSSTGEIMARINSDDKYSNNAFEIISSIFNNFHYIDWLTTRPAGFTNSEEIIENLVLWSLQKHFAKADNNIYIHKEGTFWRRALWEKAGSSLNTSLNTAFDFELWTRFFRYSHLYTVNKIVAFRRYKQYKNEKPFRILSGKYLKETEKILVFEKQLFNLSKKQLLPAPELLQYNEKGILLFNHYYGKNTGTLKKIALILWENDKNIPAINYLAKAINLNPESEELVVIYAELLFLLGFTNKAKTVYRSFLKNHPGNDTVSKLYIQKVQKDKKELQNEYPYLISAIVLLNNTENLLDGCINDLQSQTIADKLEIIFVDGNSNSIEQEIIYRYQKKYPNIRYLKNSVNESGSMAFNRAINISSGKYITKVKVGNRYKNNALELIIREFDYHSETEVIFSKLYINKSENAKFRLNPGASIPEIYNDFRSFLTNSFIISFIQTVWKKTIHEHYGFYDANEISEAENEFIIRILQTAKFKVIEHVLGYYLYSPAYTEHSGNYNEIREDNKLLKIYLEAYDKGEIIKHKNKLLTLDISELFL